LAQGDPKTFVLLLIKTMPQAPAREEVERVKGIEPSYAAWEDWALCLF